MAWRNIKLNINFPNIAQCEITDFALLELTTWPNDWSPYVSAPTAVASDFNVGSDFETVMGSGSNRIDANKTGSSYSSTVRIYMSGYNNYLSYGNEFITDKWGYIAAVNDETQKGFIAFLKGNSSSFSNWAGSYPPLPNEKAPSSQTLIRSLMYTLLTGNAYIPSYGAAGGGSGHIADGEVPTFNKYMVGYNVPTSNDAEIKTRTTTKHSPTPISGYAKEGNGYCRITYLGPTPAPSIKNITYDGVFGYVDMDISQKWKNVYIYYKVGSVPSGRSDSNAIKCGMVMNDSWRTTNIAKIPLKGNTTYYFVVAYSAETWTSDYQWTDPIVYTTETSSVSGIEVIDLDGIISSRMQSTALNQFLNSGYIVNPFVGDQVIQTLGKNYIPPEYSARDDDEWITISALNVRIENLDSLKLSYKNYYDSSGFCALQWYANAAGDEQEWDSEPDNYESDIQNDYVNTVMFLLDHDNKRGMPVLISGKTLSNKTIRIRNFWAFSQGASYNYILALWYRYLYENRKVQTREQLIYMDDEQLADTIKDSYSGNLAYFTNQSSNIFPNGYNAYSAARENDYSDSEIVITAKVKNCLKISSISFTFESKVSTNEYAYHDAKTYNGSASSKSSNVYGDTTLRQASTNYNILNDISDNNEHIIVIKYKAKLHSEGYVMDAIESYLDGVLVNTTSCYEAGTTLILNAGPLGNGVVNNISYSFPYNNVNNYVGVTFNDTIKSNEVHSLKIGNMNTMIFTAPYNTTMEWNGLVTKGNYVQDYGMDLISYFQRMYTDATYNGETIYQDSEFKLHCTRESNALCLYLTRYSTAPTTRSEEVAIGQINLSQNNYETYTHCYICFSFNDHIPNPYVSTDFYTSYGIYLFVTIDGYPDNLYALSSTVDRSIGQHLYNRFYLLPIIQSCLEEFTLELVK